MKRNIWTSQLAMLFLLGAGQAVADVPPATTAAVAPMNHYALILPQNLPHLMGVISKRGDELGLNEKQQAAFKAVMAEVPAAIGGRFKAAQAEEAAIARAVLHEGATPEALATSLDRLAASKREAAEIHIRCVNRVRQILEPAQYEKLLALAGVAAH